MYTTCGAYRSARRPARRRKDAKTIAYEDGIHASLARDMDRSLAIGSVMMNIAVVPAPSMKIERH